MKRRKSANRDRGGRSRSRRRSDRQADRREPRRESLLQGALALKVPLICIVVASIVGIAFPFYYIDWSQLHLSALCAPGVLLGTVLLLSRESLARRQLSLAHQKLERALEVKKVEVSTLMEAFPIGVFVISTLEKVRHANHQVCSLLGASAAELKKRPWMTTGNIQNRERERELWKAAQAGGVPYEGTLLVSGERGVRVVQVRATPSKYQGIIVAYIGVMIDITDSEARYSALSEQLKGIVEGQDQLLRGVALLGEEIAKCYSVQSASEARAAALAAEALVGEARVLEQRQRNEEQTEKSPPTRRSDVMLAPTTIIEGAADLPHTAAILHTSSTKEAESAVPRRSKSRAKKKAPSLGEQ